jgi:hypothetical protein
MVVIQAEQGEHEMTAATCSPADYRYATDAEIREHLITDHGYDAAALASVRSMASLHYDIVTGRI